MSDVKKEDYAIITRDDRIIYLSKIFGLNNDGEYTIASTEYEHNAEYQENQATDGGFELGNRRYGTREVTFSGYVVHKEAQLKEIIALCHRIEFLQSPQGSLAKAQIESTSINWLEGNYLGIGEFELTIRMLDPFFLGRKFVAEEEVTTEYDRITYHYPVASEYNQIDYNLRIIMPNVIKYVPRYSHPEVIDYNNIVLKADEVPDVPTFPDLDVYENEKDRKRPDVSCFEEKPERTALIKRIIISNGKQYGELDASMDAPPLFGTIYDTIVVDTKNQSIRGQLRDDQPENLYRHRLRGSSFNGILPNEKLQVTIIGEELDLINVVMRHYDKEVF